MWSLESKVLSMECGLCGVVFTVHCGVLSVIRSL